MKKYNFPYIALGLGLVFLLVILIGSQSASDGRTTLPLLTLLAVSEVAFFATAIAGYIGVKQIKAVDTIFAYKAATGICIIMSIVFMTLGINLWPL